MTGLIVFDSETTDPDPQKARLVSAYVGLLDEHGNVLAGQEWIVKPEGFEIPDAAAAIHGITTERALQEGRPLGAVTSEISRILHEQCVTWRMPLAGQNITYDLTLLDREVGRVRPESMGVERWLSENGVTVLDSLVLDKKLFKFRRGSGMRQLVNLAEVYGVALSAEEAHGAQADAIAAGRIVQKQLQHEWLRDLQVAEIHRRQIAWKAEQSADLQRWFRTKAPANRRDPLMVINPSWPIIPRPASTP